MPARRRRVLFRRGFLPNRAPVSSRARTCCAPQNGLRRLRLTTEARRRRQFASGDDAVVPSTRRGDTSKFRMRVETTSPDSAAYETTAEALLPLLRENSFGPSQN